MNPRNTNANPRLVPAKRAARELGVPYSTIRDSVHRGELAVVRLGRNERHAAWYFGLEAGASPAEVNQELAILRRAFRLASEADKYHGRIPKIRLLQERNVLWAEHEALQQAGTICPYVFHRNGRRIKSLRASWADACTAAGYPGKLLNDLRRSAVRNMERAGLSRSVAMQLTGHKTEAVYRRYAITSEADLREGVERLNAAPSHGRAMAG